MRMKRFIYFFSLIVFSPTFLNGQNPNYSDFISVADKIVIRLTNQEYFDHLKRDSIPFDAYFEMMDSIYTYPKIYSVTYVLKNRNEFNNMHVINEIGGLGPAGMFVELNDKLELIEPRRFSMESEAKRQLKAFNRFKTTNLILKENAENIADKYFSEKFKKPYGNYLFIYDSNADLFLWRFEKFKGFKKVVVEEVFIDAETGKFVRKKETPFVRNFWKALFDYRGI